MADDDDEGRDPAAAREAADRPTPDDSAKPASDGCRPDARSERLAAFDHIADLTVAFARMARQRNFETLAHLLDMAHLQARQDASGLRSGVGDAAD